MSKLNLLTNKNFGTAGIQHIIKQIKSYYFARHSGMFLAGGRHPSKGYSFQSPLEGDKLYAVKTSSPE
jgi:hypothetical protein